MSELAALVRFVHLTAAILLAGGLGFRLLVAQPAFAQAKQSAAALEQLYWRAQLRHLRWCVAFLCITLPLSLWLHAANVSGSSLPALSALFLLADGNPIRQSMVNPHGAADRHRGIGQSKTNG